MVTRSPIILRGDRNQCGSCGELFNSSAAFDKHRMGDFGKDRRCRSQEEMRGKGMAKNAAGFWIGSPYTGPARNWPTGRQGTEER